ncbi:MAG: NADH-quinone oxidoreductase subunit J [Acidobacteria bacterium]|nr:NADH-quinone oxidoreductase subunit J [Acidobacteriota bacterium]
MTAVFYVSGAVAIAATLLMLTRLNVVHALLYLVVSLLAVAIVFFVIGAPFVAALEVIIYAGAIMVLFIFVIMMLNLGEEAVRMEENWLNGRMWIGPAILCAVLAGEVGYLLWGGARTYTTSYISPKQVGIALYGPYLIGVELVAMLLLGGMVAAYHLGWRNRFELEMQNGDDSHTTRTASGRNTVRSGAVGPLGAP